MRLNSLWRLFLLTVEWFVKLKQSHDIFILFISTSPDRSVQIGLPETKKFACGGAFAVSRKAAQKMTILIMKTFKNFKCSLVPSND